MPRARVKFRPPVPHLGGPFKYSVDHPDDDLRILSAYPVDDGLQVVLEATTTETESFVRLFDDVPVDLSVELLHVDDRTALLQFRLPFVPSPFTAIFASKNLPQFPYTLDDGWMVCELTTTHERLSEFDEELDATGFEYEVE